MRESALDQALGLRKLFQPRSARVLPVVAGGGESPGRAALMLARGLNDCGHRCLIVDATRGDIARRLGLAVRYELCHVASGERALSDVVHQSGEIRVLPAGRGLAELAQSRNRGARLARLARDLGAREDWILIAADASLAEIAAMFAEGADVAIACEPSGEARTSAYSVIKRIVQATGTQGFHVVSDAGHGEETARQLDRVASRFLGARVMGGSDPREWSCAKLD